ncbi:hypothetical protein [Eoetvoesiella caeni]|uniref:Uncharacterized protein n=1 Tax=Eoetvoesiella caeni TaxID=645616 RepID=A0A366GYY3_9BURK|nr:hypothetical protein [Eoetvoesiella caeni]MCI2811310.1 hypothetical protein [Eoetvoesiella caeni]NYT57191.1 hypothetical protein [Eoetvoesiella caeni]RBP33634.1 hypothetical protein DFR37_12625 [Eoetvoesiella caeni]
MATPSIHEFGTAPQHANDGYQIATLAYGSDEVVLGVFVNQDVRLVRGPSVHGQPGHYEFAVMLPNRDAAQRPTAALTETGTALTVINGLQSALAQLLLVKGHLAGLMAENQANFDQLPEGLHKSNIELQSEIDVSPELELRDCLDDLITDLCEALAGFSPNTLAEVLVNETMPVNDAQKQPFKALSASLATMMELASLKYGNGSPEFNEAYAVAKGLLAGQSE